MKKSQKIILDSSVIAKWIFIDEYNPKAHEIKNIYGLGVLSITVPTLLFYEINNILKSAVLSKRIESENALQALDDFLALNLIAYSSDILLKSSLRIALKFDILTYDASYLALAEQLKVPFITADQKLLNKVKSEFIVKLEDYKF